VLISRLALDSSAVRAAATKTSHPSSVRLNTPQPSTPLEHNNRGVELGQKGLWPQAIHEHELALIADPNNQQFRTNLSAAQLRYGDLLSGRKDFYNAIKQYHGALYADSGNLPADEHLDECLKHLGKNPFDLKTRLSMGENAEISGEYEAAIVEYRKCTHISDSGETHARLGQVLLKAGKVVDAFNELKIAVAKPWEDKDQNDLAACHRQLGDILHQYAYIARDSGRGTIGMKRLANAAIEYRRAATINPLDTNAIRGLIEVTRDAIAINPSFDNHLMLAGAYQLSGDLAHARLEYEQCFKLNPSNPVLNAARRSFWMAIVHSPSAPADLLASTLQKIQTALSSSPDDAELLYLLARAKESQGSKEEALKYYQKALSINPHVNPDLALGIARLTGNQPTTQKSVQPVAEEVPNRMIFTAVENKMQAGDLDGAQKDLLTLLDKNPKNAHAWLLLGNTHERKGDLDQAEVAYRQSRNLGDVEAAAALRQIGTSRVQPMMQEADKAMEKKDWVKAAACLREALSIGPDLSFVHRKLAEVLRQEGDTREADQEMEKATALELPSVNKK